MTVHVACLLIHTCTYTCVFGKSALMWKYTTYMYMRLTYLVAIGFNTCTNLFVRLFTLIEYIYTGYIYV